MPSEIRRKTPEEFLRECQAEEADSQRGRLKIFLGYASGVGKSYRMLDEARRRCERGQDVVVGAIQPAVPAEVEPWTKKLPESNLPSLLYPSLLKARVGQVSRPVAMGLRPTKVDENGCAGGVSFGWRRAAEVGTAVE